MALSPSQIAILRADMAQIALRPEQSGFVFFTSLYKLAPALRAVWPGEPMAQSRNLIGTLSYLIDLLDQPDQFRAALSALASDLRAKGMSPRGYMALHASLSDMVAHHASAQAAWDAAIDLILGTMMQEAHGPRSHALPLAA